MAAVNVNESEHAFIFFNIYIFKSFEMKVVIKITEQALR